MPAQEDSHFEFKESIRDTKSPDADASVIAGKKKEVFVGD